MPSASACVSASCCSSHFLKEADHLQAMSYQTNLGVLFSSNSRFMSSVAYAWRSPVKEFIRYATKPWRHRHTPKEVMSYCATNIHLIRHLPCFVWG